MIEIEKNGNLLTIDGKNHTLNIGYYEIIDEFAIFISVDENETIRRLDWRETLVNKEQPISVNELLNLLNL